MGTTRPRYGDKGSRGGFWVLTGLVLLLLLLWLLFAPGSGYLYYRSSRKELAAIQQENARLEQNNAALRREIERLKTDEAYIEKVAREKHGLLKKDERVYEFNRPGGK
ncbi:MAG: septum formation initiator family protein [bacterium]|nr:septum formation initiator family protein [bacterium]